MLRHNDLSIFTARSERLESTTKARPRHLSVQPGTWMGIGRLMTYVSAHSDSRCLTGSRGQTLHHRVLREGVRGISVPLPSDDPTNKSPPRAPAHRFMHVTP